MNFAASSSGPSSTSFDAKAARWNGRSLDLAASAATEKARYWQTDASQCVCDCINAQATHQLVQVSGKVLQSFWEVQLAVDAGALDGMRI